MLKTIRIIAFMLVWIPLAVLAADRPVSEADFSAYKELAQTKLDAAKESLQKDREKVEVRLDAQDKRIGDLNFTLTVFGILITLLMVGLGVASWFSAGARAREEARKWFEENSSKLEKEIKGLSQRIEESHAKIEKAEEDVAQHAQSTKSKMLKDAEAEIAKLQETISSLSGKTASGVSATAGKDGEALEEMEQVIRSKPETEYGFDDWNTRAFNAWHKNDLEGAARYWKATAQAEDAADEQIAQSMLNAGVAIWQLNRSEDAIAVYDEVVKRFGDAPEAALRELVARALVNEGVALGQMNRCKDEIVVYDEVVKRFGDAPEAALRELVARALINKGVALRQMNRSEDAIVVCDEVVKRFGDAPEEVLRELVAQALNGKGYILLCRAKQCWADGAARLADLQAAANLFEKAVGNIENKPIVWGNQAYAAFLLGQPEVARPLLRQALQQGGEALYKGTLDDLDIHPVPVDKEFRTMLEELWTEVKPKA